MRVNNILVTAVFLALAVVLVSGCVNQTFVTTRPEYAFPQNLISLCGEDTRLTVLNKGTFAASEPDDQGNQLLLSPHLLKTSLAENRHIVANTLSFNADRRIQVTSLYADGRNIHETISPARTHCNEQGEFIVNYASDSFYFWASVGNLSREMSLWTNHDGDLIAQNRWKETHRGLIGGEIIGDAWAIFKHDNPTDAESTSTPDLADSLDTSYSGGSCKSLDGEFDPKGETIAPDGRLDIRLASAQFFREEVIGAQAENQDLTSATKFAVFQDKINNVTLNLYEDGELRATRTLDAADISCKEGKWEYKGEKRAHSAWALLAASGGIYWEDLTLWRDEYGDLLVKGLYKSRGMLLLVPFGHSEGIFVAYPKQ